VFPFFILFFFLSQLTYQLFMVLFCLCSFASLLVLSFFSVGFFCISLLVHCSLA